MPHVRLREALNRLFFIFFSQEFEGLIFERIFAHVLILQEMVLYRMAGSLIRHDLY